MKRYVLLIAICALFLPGGCVTQEKVKTISADATAAIIVADRHIQQLREELAEAKDESAAGRIRNELLRWEGRQAEIVEAMKTMNAGFQKAETEGDYLATGIRTIAPLLGQYGGLALLFAGTAGGVWNHLRKQGQGIKAVENVDAVLTDPAFAKLTFGDFVSGEGKLADTALHKMKVLDRANGGGVIVDKAKIGL